MIPSAGEFPLAQMADSPRPQPGGIRMRRKLLTLALIAISASLVARQAAAMWELMEKLVTPENAKAYRIAVEADNADQQGYPVVRFKIVRTIDNRRDGFRDARLTVRKDGKIVSFGSPRITSEKGEDSWKFDVSPDYLAGSVLEILVFDRTTSDPVIARGITYKIKLSDFPIAGKPRAERATAGAPQASPR
jgi:hypothetical protein